MVGWCSDLDHRSRVSQERRRKARFSSINSAPVRESSPCALPRLARGSVGFRSLSIPPPAPANFPAAECICPIFPGPGLADLNGGNMTGDCNPPSSDQVWSLYSTASEIPQAINNWKPGKKSAVGMQECQTGDFANCFSLACRRSGTVTGNQEVATCTCPINESLEGESAGAPFETPAGQCNPDLCSAPRGGRIPDRQGSARPVPEP